jgi:hypothetical protein
VNPYAYVGNRPLNATDPTGYIVDGGISIYVANFIVGSIFSSLADGILNHGGLPPPPATALPGRSAQNGAGMCGAGLFAPPCTGKPLYAAAPPVGRSGLPTSSWGETAVDDAYAQENLELFLLDLGINAVDILILSPVNDAKGAYDAARRGEAATAVLYVGFTICDVAKPCQSVLAPTKAIRRAAKSVRRAESAATEVVQRAMSRAELDATLKTGLLRGGRAGTHYVSDAVNSSAGRAQQRLALPQQPEIRATIEVRKGTFSAPSTVAPYRLPNGTILHGGGTERTAVGEVPARILRVDEL